MSPEDCDNKFIPPEFEDTDSDNYVNGGAVTVTTTRSGRVSKPYNYKNSFLNLYGAKNLGSTNDTLCLHPYYHDKGLDLHLGVGISYSNNYFSDDVTITNMSMPEYSELILSLKINKYELCSEVLEWF